MADLNVNRKKQVLDRARRSRNHKVLTLLEHDFFPKIDQAGPMAGIWLESLEHDFDALTRKPLGLMGRFSPADFDALFKALFGYDR